MRLVGATAAMFFLMLPAADSAMRLPAPLRSTACDEVRTLALPSSRITSATLVSDGTRPAFCRVAATLKPSSDSDIKIEVWLPAAGWNGKFQAVGNGAFNGTIGYPAMTTALARGYATASTDTGPRRRQRELRARTSREGRRLRVARGARDDRRREAHHRAPTTTARRAFSSWNGCSAGGRQAHEGGAAISRRTSTASSPGAPGLDWTGRAAQAVRVAQALEHERGRAAAGAAASTPARRPCSTRATRSDGVKDGLIGDPARCTFDPGVLDARASRDRRVPDDSAGRDRAADLLDAPANPKTEARDCRSRAGQRAGMDRPGLDRVGARDRPRSVPLPRVRGSGLDDPEVQLRHRHRARGGRRRRHDQRARSEPEAVLRSRRQADSVSRLERSADLAGEQHAVLHARASTTLGGAAKRPRRRYRLFMAPGMGHCGGGEGPNTFDMVSALEQWVEHGKAPDRIVASHATNGVVDRTRPLCPYPQVAAYNGTGSADEAGNFSCRIR